MPGKKIFFFVETFYLAELSAELQRKTIVTPARGSYFSFVPRKVESSPHLLLHCRELVTTQRGLLTHPTWVLYPWLPSTEYPGCRSCAESSSTPTVLRNILLSPTHTAATPRVLSSYHHFNKVVQDFQFRKTSTQFIVQQFNAR